jgi:hypothetical protein
MKRQIRVQMGDILDAMTAAEDPALYFLDLEKGTVMVVASDDAAADGEDDEAFQLIDDNPNRYAEIPRVEGRDEYDWMADFADSVDEEDIRDRLAVALRGKGSFGRFRDVVFQYSDLKQQWLAFKQQRLADEAKEWLEGLEIEPVYELRPIEGPPPVEAKPAAVKLGLLDVLLLGAPDGKTERIDGRVLRQVNLRTPSAARGVFKTVARELCAFYGMAWRNRFVEGKNELSIERAHIAIVGNSVVVSIVVTDATWKAFASG